MSEPKKERILFALSMGLLLVFYAIGLFFNVTGDAAKYAFISKNIAQNNQWLFLNIQGEPYFQKPPFLFWLSALSFKTLGVSNLTFKLPIFLYSLLGFWGTYRLGKSLFDKKIGVMAATMLAFSVVSVLYNSDIHTDIVLQTNVVLSMWLLYDYLKTRKLIFLIAGAFTVGLSILTKGPFGAIIPFFAVLGYLISQRQYKMLYSPMWLIFILIVGAMTIPALLPLFEQKGTEGLWFFIWENNIGRVTGSYMGTNPDPLYYLHSFAYLLLPWSIVVGAGVYFQFKKFIKKQFLPQEHFLFWGTWVVFILLSISMSKLQNYAQSLVPLIFIITANAWQHYFMRKKNPWKLAHQILIYTIWGLIIIIPMLINLKKGIPFSLLSLGLLLVSFTTIQDLLPSKKLYHGTLLLFLGMAFTLNAYILPKLLTVQAEPEAAEIIAKKIMTGEKVYNYNLLSLERREQARVKTEKEKTSSFDKTPNVRHFFLNYELMFYSDQKINHIENSTQLNRVLHEKGAWIYTDPKGKTAILRQAKYIESIYTLDHFNLRRPGHSIDWKNRRIKFDKMYLIHLKP
ncbi:MAG: ArnT family glycosyltransferase [Prolixibacteraceae bacterium]